MGGLSLVWRRAHPRTATGPVARVERRGHGAGV